MDLLYPLVLFYERAGRPLPEVWEIDGAEVPEPYRRLLVHRHDMTPTLAGFHGAKIGLKVLERELREDSLAREVVLTLDGSERVVEFGAIVIYLRCFPEPARAQVVAGGSPLGTILAEHQLQHRSCPVAFFGMTPDRFICDALGLPEAQTLYGRRNRHLVADNGVMADIIEILPPAGEQAR